MFLGTIPVDVTNPPSDPWAFGWDAIASISAALAIATAVIIPFIERRIANAHELRRHRASIRQIELKFEFDNEGAPTNGQYCGKFQITNDSDSRIVIKGGLTGPTHFGFLRRNTPSVAFQRFYSGIEHLKVRPGEEVTMAVTFADSHTLSVSLLFEDERGDLWIWNNSKTYRVKCLSRTASNGNNYETYRRL